MSAQRLEDGREVALAQGAIALQHLAHHLADVRGEVRDARGERRDLAGENRLEDLARVVALEGTHTRQTLVEDHAQGPDVGARVDVARV
jgi:hypothetical protein